MQLTPQMARDIEHLNVAPALPITDKHGFVIKQDVVTSLSDLLDDAASGEFRDFNTEIKVDYIKHLGTTLVGNNTMLAPVESQSALSKIPETLKSTANKVAGYLGATAALPFGFGIVMSHYAKQLRK